LIGWGESKAEQSLTVCSRGEGVQHGFTRTSDLRMKLLLGSLFLRRLRRLLALRLVELLQSSDEDGASGVTITWGKDSVGACGLPPLVPHTPTAEAEAAEVFVASPARPATFKGASC